MGRDYREEGLRLYGDRCIHCGTAEEVKIHHMDGDHDNDRRDNLVPLCQECHVQLHKGSPPFTVWLALGQPVIESLDELREARGLRSRSEVIARLLQEAEAGDLSDKTWSLLTTHNDTMYRDLER
jgi:cytochrome c553